MESTTLAPFFLSRASDAATLDPYRAVFRTDLARRAHLTLVAQAYEIDAGITRKIGGPILGFQAPLAGKTAFITPRAPAPCESRITPNDLSTLRAQACPIRVPDSLSTEMLYVTSRRLWMLATPHAIAMQAMDVARELKAATRITRDLARSTWARSAYATVRTAPASSAHEALQLLRYSREAIQALEAFRPHVFEAARSCGYHLGPLTQTEIAEGAEA